MKHFRILNSHTLQILRLLTCCAALLSAAGCTKYEALDATVPSFNYIGHTDFPYGEQPRQLLDVYVPRRAQSNARVVVFFYGGAWDSGRRQDYRFAAEALTSEGFIAVVPDYRLYPDVTFPAFVEDGALAIRWVNDHIEQFGGDPRRIYLMGHSAGAHIAALLTLDGHYLKDAGVDPAIIRATIAMSGPYSFTPGRHSRPIFGHSANDPTIDPRGQPIHFANAHSPPILLIHGAKDDIIPPGNALRLNDAIRVAGGDCKCIIYPNLGHAGVALSLAFPFRWMAPVLQDTANFIRAH